MEAFGSDDVTRDLWSREARLRHRKNFTKISKMVSSNGGVYRVKEAGLEFEHSKEPQEDTLQTPEEFLESFRYVNSLKT